MSVDWTDGHTVREPGVGQFVGVGQVVCLTFCKSQSETELSKHGVLPISF